MLSPDIKVQTESKKHKPQSDIRKKSLIDSGIELLFKKNTRIIKDGGVANEKFRAELISGPSTEKHHQVHQQPHHDERKWRPFESIKVYTEKRKGHETKSDVHFAEECYSTQPPVPPPPAPPIYKLHNDSAQLDEHGSPKHKLKTMLSGNKGIDHLLHTIIKYILRDYIDSWFVSLSDNKEFSECRTRNCIEESLQNVCQRIRNTQWIPLMTTKLIDNVAMHARLYRLATETVNLSLDEDDSKYTSDKVSPHRRGSGVKVHQHRRNKSETDLNWYLGQASGQGVQKNVANSKFYTNVDRSEEKKYMDPETKLINAFFGHCDSYRDECMDERALEGLFGDAGVIDGLLTWGLFCRLFDALHGDCPVFYPSGGGFCLSAIAHIPQHSTGECRVQACD